MGSVLVAASILAAPIVIGASSSVRAAYDVETGGVLQFKRNAGAQTCPLTYRRVCLNRTRVVASPDQSEDCGNFANATCSTTASTLATDVFCVCRH